MRVEVGDWVRFYQAGVLVIGEVNYLQVVSNGLWTMQACTNIGVVSVEDVIEVRGPHGIVMCENLVPTADTRGVAQ